MIRTALEFIKTELETFMVEREQDPAYSLGSVVSLASLVLPDGTYNAKDTSHISMMIVNLEDMCREGKRPYYVPANSKEFYRLNPPVELDISVMFAAHSIDYPTALRDISDVIGFFQSNPVFDNDKYPGMNATVLQPDIKPWQLIERLTFQLRNLSFDQLNNIWGMLGAKFMPAVVYKMQMLTVFDTKGKDKSAAISQVNYAEN